jgi:hypothetical protein
MSDDRQAPFRQCFCRAPGCGAMFFICPGCDQEQVYCGKLCSKLARLAKHRVANRRHQQSEEGRLDHRDRQRAYRRRKAEVLSQSATIKSVTDHTPAPTASCVTLLAAAPAPAPRPSSTISPPPRPRQWLFYSDRPLIICRFCGRRGRFINPFHQRSRKR